MRKIIDVLSPNGEKAGSVRLPSEIFDVKKVSIPLLHQVVVAQNAAARQGTHKTKTRGEVRGGGKKPHRQKGTGRARQGSTRAPQSTGGGVAHGRVPRDYSQRTPKKMKTAALRGALTDRAHHNRIHVVTSVVDGPNPSTKAARNLLNQISERKKLLLVAGRDEQVTRLSARNLPQVHILDPGQLNTYDVLNADDVVFTQHAYEVLVERFAKPESPELPPIPKVPVWASPESEQRFKSLPPLSPDQERVAYWTIRLSEEAQRWTERHAIDPENEHISIGRLDPAYDDVTQEAFGVILYRIVSKLPPGLSAIIGHLNVEGHPFTIVRRNVVEEPALLIDPPPGGTVACWACTKQKPQREGWLTARHVVHPSGHVHFSQGGVSHGDGAVIRRGPGQIDAALLSTDQPPNPPHEANLPVMPIPALNLQPVSFVTQNGHVIRGIVEDVTDTFPILTEPNNPMHLKLSVHGAHGDSGALIRMAPTGEAAGIYLKEYRANARWGKPATIGGAGLAAEQIEAIMRIELRDNGSA